MDMIQNLSLSSALVAEEPESSPHGIRTSGAELGDGAPDQSPEQFRLRECRGTELQSKTAELVDHSNPGNCDLDGGWIGLANRL